jgi:RNA polymerase sigma-70 factor (ECF subfamily)
VVRIALNTARSLRERERAQKRRPEAGSCRLPAGAAANHVSAPHDPVEHRELVEALRREIAALDATAREVVERRAAGKSYGEIAAALGLCAGTVKSRLHRARTELRARLAAVL